MGHCPQLCPAWSLKVFQTWSPQVVAIRLSTFKRQSCDPWGGWLVQIQGLRYGFVHVPVCLPIAIFFDVPRWRRSPRRSGGDCSSAATTAVLAQQQPQQKCRRCAFRNTVLLIVVAGGVRGGSCFGVTYFCLADGCLSRFPILIYWQCFDRRAASLDQL